MLVDVQSEHQHIQIFDTVDNGHLLVLDGNANLAESDIVPYTHAIMDLPHAKYGDCQVLILGGGDGSLLKELLELEQPPRHITMIDLDNQVMNACSEHMRSVCGPYLDPDKRKGPNYEVICGDAFNFMNRAIASGCKFDYVFGDLTDTPTAGHGDDDWNFLKRTLTLGVQLLKPGSGIYMTHCNGKSVAGIVAEYEQFLRSLRIPDDPSLRPKFTRSESFVPSFREVWVFYQLSMRKL